MDTLLPARCPSRLPRLALVLALAVAAIGMSWTPRPAPASAAVTSLAGITQVDVGTRFACALFGSGHVTCWGLGTDGQLGNGSRVSSAVPMTVTGLDDATKIAVGGATACALRDAGGVVCWGSNSFGQLGSNTTVPDRPTPAPVTGLSNAIDVVAGVATFCARVSGGSLLCWGNNQGRQIVDDSDVSMVFAPTTIPGIANVAEVTVGSLHICTRSTTQQMRCWGANTEGQLGNGSTNAVPAGSSVAPTGLTQVVRIAAGSFHTCAQGTFTGQLRLVCWGRNDADQVLAGQGATVLSPVVRGQPSVLRLAAGDDSACIVEVDGDLVCWGSTHGVPSGVSGLGSAAVGSDSTCAVTDATSVRCWGSRWFGALGNALDTIPGAPAGYVVTPLPEVRPMRPVRLLDTRPAGSTVDGQALGAGVVPAGGQISVAVAGRGGVTAGKAVVFSIAARNTAAAGSMTLWRCSDPRPAAASLRYVAGSSRTNLAVVALAADGTVCLHTSAASHVTLDVVATIGNAAAYVPLTPARLVDTRANGSTIDDLHEGAGPLLVGAATPIEAKGRGGVPTNAAAVVVNITTANPAGLGRIQVYKCTQGAAESSALTVEAGRMSTTLTLGAMTVGTDVCLESSVATDVMVDVVGYFGSATATRVFMPMRIMDTRPSGDTVDDDQEMTGVLAPGDVRRIDVLNRWDQGPLAARTMLLDLTVYKPVANGTVTVWACGTTKGLASFVVEKGQRRTSSVWVAVGRADQVCVTSSVQTHLTVDSRGYWAF